LTDLLRKTRVQISALHNIDWIGQMLATFAERSLTASCEQRKDEASPEASRNPSAITDQARTTGLDFS
jgi:hypothetical protein